jgi:hypothetical protein
MSMSVPLATGRGDRSLFPERYNAGTSRYNYCPYGPRSSVKRPAPVGPRAQRNANTTAIKKIRQDLKLLAKPRWRNISGAMDCRATGLYAAGEGRHGSRKLPRPAGRGVVLSVYLWLRLGGSKGLDASSSQKLVLTTALIEIGN